MNKEKGMEYKILNRFKIKNSNYFVIKLNNGNVCTLNGADMYKYNKSIKRGYVRNEKQICNKTKREN